MFDLTNRVVAITGGAGLLGSRYAHALARCGACVAILDLVGSRVEKIVNAVNEHATGACRGFVVDITDEDAVAGCADAVAEAFGRVDSLVNNAANNPKVEDGLGGAATRLENFSLARWNADVAVGLTGAFLCAKHFGARIARGGNGGTIVNIASDLGVIAPDQRLYRQDGLPGDEQEVKPVTYSVVKSGIIGLTRYLSTYWAEQNVRSNALCLGGVQTSQPESFLRRIESRIPLGRMAMPDEYDGTIVYMVSDEARYMNGAVVSVDGGRTAW
ncbi:SDR family oxidoreductase [uncultured Pseudodesulfovibrio sp.]|uniref:SDR family oxidoreductase n=1 Tax=uncultured Pseudodesulfovibrio sp. TaxID=2035858 RepID=UPI0029C8763D|nr:SDR family oxidoreductase [uncultured Pseudodesulfovibrio sp.]